MRHRQGEFFSAQFLTKHFTETVIYMSRQSSRCLCQLLAIVTATAFLDLPPAKAFGSEAVYQDRTASIEARVEDLFSRLTPEEKISLLSGTGFTTQPIPRLGVPPLAMADAGEGVRGGQESMMGPATAFPAGVAMASTWDTNLLWQIGRAIGEEALNKGSGAQMLLGPAVNIQRSPLGGRNGEYFSEDPFVAARLGVSYIQGMQSAGCAACVKHYVAYNQEHDRYTVDTDVGERALREIYMPAFEAAVKDGHV
jgi:beta-glucosidase